MKKRLDTCSTDYKCKSCLQLLRSATNAFLTLTFAAQLVYLALFAVHWKIPAPVRLMDVVQQELDELGLSCVASKLEMDLSGALHAYDARLYLKRIKDPLFEAEKISFRFGLWGLLFNQKIVFKGLGIVDGAFFCPPIYSPSGTRLTFIEHLNLGFGQERYAWKLNQFSGLFLGAPLFGHGRISKDFFLSKSAFEFKTQDLGPYIEELVSVLEYKKYLEMLTGPRAFFEARAQGGATELRVHCFAEKWESFQGIYASHIVGNITTRGASINELRDTTPLRLTLKNFHWESYVDAPEVFLEAVPSAGFKEWENINFVGNHVVLDGVEVDALAARLHMSSLVHHVGGFWAATDSSFLKGDFKWNWDDRSGNIDFSGTINPDLCLRLLEPYPWSSYIQEIDFKEPLQLSGVLDISGDFEWNYAQLKAYTGPAEIAGRDVQGGEARVYVDGTRLFVDDIFVFASGWTLRGSFEQAFQDLAFRFLLNDSFDPKLLNAWLPSWWADIWRPLSFHQKFLEGNIDIQGAWSKLENIFLYADAKIEDAYYSEQYVPLAKSHVLLLNGNVLLDNFLIGDALGAARGNALWEFGEDMDGLHRFYITLSSTLPLHYFGVIPAIASYVEVFECSGPPQVTFSGEFFPKNGLASGKTDKFTLDASVPDRLSFADIPLDELSFTASNDGPSIVVESIDCRMAQGVGTGQAQWFPGNHELKFSCRLDGVDRKEIIDSFFFLKSLDQRPNKLGSGEGASTSGTVNLVLSAEGNLEDFSSFVGEGSLSLKEKGLGEVHFLGGLSKLINAALILPLASFSLDEAHASFFLKENRLYFPDAEVTGPAMKIFAEGTYSIPDQGLNFKLSIFPFGEVPILSHALLLFAPLNEALALRLTGTVDDPIWRFAHLSGKKQAKLTKSVYRK